MLASLLLVLIVLGWVYWCVAALMTWRHFHRAPRRTDWAPPVSILKPVRGVDAEALENFASFCRQDYPTFELVFGVADPNDPALPVIRRLQQRFVDVPIRVVVASPSGANQKASLLHALAQAAAHPVLVASDSDMRVGPDYLRTVVAPLGDPAVGVVTCLYRGARPASLAARLEALHMGVTFLPSALVAREAFHMSFAMGATVALRAADLARAGGFVAIRDHLADDYQVGARVAALGRTVELSSCVVDSVLGPTTLREQWAREVRWSRCARVSRPAGFLGMLITFCTPLALLHFLGAPSQFSAFIALVSIAVRYATSAVVAEVVADRSSQRWLVLLPLRDLLSAAVWLASLVGQRVVWRGDAFRVRRDGTLERVMPAGVPLQSGGQA